jgi:transposase-like protein
MKCAVVSGIEALDEVACRAFWVRRLHPAGPHCPDCRVALDGRQAETFAAGGRVHCNSCGRWFTYRTGTLFTGTTLNDRQLFLLILLIANNCPASSIAASCRLSEDTVYAWQRRFGEALK